MERRKGKAAIPAARKAHVRVMSGFAGLDMRGGVHEGFLEQADNIDPRRLPALATTLGPRKLLSAPAGRMLSLHVLGENILIVFENGGTVYLYRRRPDGSTSTVAMTTDNPGVRRTILPFNLYSNPANPLSGTWRHMAVVYPDGLWFEPEAATIQFDTIIPGFSAAPSIDHACVHLSRVFGARGDRLYASAFNNPADWNLDTADDIDASHAWASTVQSNTRGTGDFTALCVYDGHVMAFKRSFCHILNNNKNPFRVADLMPLGTPDGRTLAEVDGKLFFVGEDGVYRYNGESATRISDLLGEQDYTGACAAGADGLYYLYLPSTMYLYTYAEKTGAWSRLTGFAYRDVVSMATDGKHCFLLCEDGTLYTTEDGARCNFSITTTPVLEDALGRVCRLSLCLTAKHADLRVVYRDSKNRETVLENRRSLDGSYRLISRAFSPADYGGKLALTGIGEMTLHELCLTVVE